MGFFRKRRPEPRPMARPPEWAAHLGADDYGRFLADIDAALVGRGHRIDDGMLTVPGQEGQFGLGTLAQNYARVDEADRTAFVREHFERMFVTIAAAVPEGEAALEVLRPRIFGTDILSTQVELVYRPLAEDLIASLALDLPDAVHGFGPDAAEATGLDNAALWERALAQIDDGLEVAATDAGPVRAYEGESLFVATRLLDLERFHGPISEDGALVAIPNRHLLLLHEIDGLDDALQALNSLVPMAQTFYAEGPGSIVPHVYWWRAEEGMMVIPVEVTAEAINISPPDEFVELLNRLG